MFLGSFSSAMQQNNSAGGSESTAASGDPPNMNAFLQMLVSVVKEVVKLSSRVTYCFAGANG